jgi:hypothetical protein
MYEFDNVFMSPCDRYAPGAFIIPLAGASGPIKGTVAGVYAFMKGI